MNSALQISSLLKFLLNFLCKLPCKLVHFTKGFVRRCFNSKSWVPFIAFLGRLLTIWRLRRNGKTFRRAQQADYSFPGTGAGSDVRQDQPIACTNLPGSAQRPGPLAPLSRSPSRAASGSDGAARSQYGQPVAYPSSMFDAGSNRSCTGLSVFSHTSNRFSIQPHAPASLHPLLHPKGNLKAAHRQFGGGPSTDNLEITSHPHMSVNPRGVHCHHRGQSSMSVTVQIENPSTESLPRSQLVDPPTLQEEPYSTGTPNIHISPSPFPNLPEGSPQLTDTASLIFDLEIPEGRFLQMIVSEQVPRYTKYVTV